VVTGVDPALRARVTDVIAFNSVDVLAYFERRSPCDAADMVAETMMAAWRRSSSMPEAAVEARMWLFGIARNVLANAERTERRRWRLADRLRLMTLPSEVSAASDEGADVRDAVARLEPGPAELIRLVHWDGFSIAESAQIIGIPASTARTQYQRAKEQLRRTLSDLDPTELSGTGHGTH
jgi:RNA polymerase sigma factor (sigma-70 family)